MIEGDHRGLPKQKPDRSGEAETLKAGRSRDRRRNHLSRFTRELQERRHGDTETRRHGDTETRRLGDSVAEDSLVLQAAPLQIFLVGSL
ncbi:hypothetical protein FF011L_54970 [Roseimaritima multifibrata]|uniref:Uncharacterized protein n=1 Tax=Roseimaritima multifibrata TaxID=1930274 RepID=A0A517MP75_9BACT|nr:hypothetical protein FF011L_54970 [Roseimaritima multifibrata]